uniref:Uncharacterized protein n=1 Tax=Oryza sativa subsp. japonica TaxID=39947 RepID=Q5Z4Y9_ORYSJ|nr:hypothetical protein [Oryza sativa Japonica Group]
MDNPRAEHKVERFLSMFYTRTRFQVGDGGQSLSSGDPTDSNRVHSNMGCFQMNITNPMGCLMLPADEHPEISLNPDEEDTVWWELETHGHFTVSLAYQMFFMASLSRIRNLRPMCPKSPVKGIGKRLKHFRLLQLLSLSTLW